MIYEQAAKRISPLSEALGDDLGAVTGTFLDQRVEPVALAKLPKVDCNGLMDRAKARERATAWKASNRGGCTLT